MSRAQTRGGGGPHRVVFGGQSLCIVPGNVIPGTEFPARLMSGRQIPWVNLAVSGSGWATQLANPTQMALILRQPGHQDATHLIMCGGTADVSSTGQQMYDQQVDVATQARAAGYSTVINTTLVGSSPMTGGQQTNRAALNVLLLSDPDEAFDAVVDFDDSALGDWTDATYYADGVHWNYDGAELAASLLVPALDAILAA